MFNIKKKYKKAFTLTEVIVYITVLAAIGGTITSLIIQMYRFQTVVEDRAQLNEDVRVLFKSVRDDMYQGNSLEVDMGGRLVIRSSFNSPAEVTYFLQGSQVYRQVTGQSPVAVSNTSTNVQVFDIQDISTPASAGVVRIKLFISNYPSGSLKPPVNEDIATTMSLKFL